MPVPYECVFEYKRNKNRQIAKCLFEAFVAVVSVGLWSRQGISAVMSGLLGSYK